MGRKPNNRKEHARIADEWLSLPKESRPSLWKFLKDRKYSVSQKSIQAELERRGLDRITGEPVAKPKEEPQTEPEPVPAGREKTDGETVIDKAIESVEEVPPEPKPKKEPEKERDEEPAPGGNLGMMIGAGLFIVSLAGAAYYFLGGRNPSNVPGADQSAGIGAGTGGRASLGLDGTGGARPERRFRTIDDF